ncbi:MAG: CRTAC1 family protein [Pedosphaera sp.]|nr:CRTAC1 family protein [Pedosphaera sp.]
MKDDKPKRQSPSFKDAGTDQDSEAEEVAHYNEATISRVFRWSAVAVLLIGCLIGGGIYLSRRKQAVAPPKVTQIAAPTIRQSAPVEVPLVNFTETSAAAGIRFVHNNGAYGDKLLPETMGGGVAFLDFDNDGAQDLLFVNSTLWPWKSAASGSPRSTMALYRNNGKGIFTDVTAGSGLEVAFYGMGVACGDFDNDSLVDVFFTGVGGNHLFKNLGSGKFKEITVEAGVGGQPTEWSTSAAWIDYDNDGLLDLFVCNYVKWSREIDIEVNYTLVGLGRAYGPPMNFQGSFSTLYHNDGNGRFSDMSAAAGIQIKNPATGVPAGKSLGVAPVDLDGDGWIDLIVANDTVQNFVLHNQRNGTFKEIGALSGVAFDVNGQSRGAMGIDTGRFRNDGSLGVAIGNFANEMTALYVSQGQPKPGALPLFTDEAIAEGIGPASRLPLKFGIFFFDYDLDGRLDVLTSNGHLEDEINKVQQSQHYKQSAQLFWNTGSNDTSTFVSVGTEKAGGDLFRPIVGRGSAYADIDGDGDLDVVLTQVGGAPLLLRNDQTLGHNWVRIKLAGKKHNRDAIGAWINLTAGNIKLSRQVMPTHSYMSQSELTVTFGLGKSEKIDSVTIIWPGGATQTVPLERIKLRATTLIEEGR